LLPPAGRDQSGAFSARSRIAVIVVLAVSLLAMRLVGLQPTVPFGLIYLFLVVVPFALGLAVVIRSLESSRVPTVWRSVLGALAGLSALCVYWPDRDWFFYPALIGASSIAVRSIAGPHDGTTRKTVSAALMVGAIYVIVWNANYLALIASRSRLHDASIRAVDEALYSAIWGYRVAYEGWFPLVHAWWLVTIFERAYLSLFAEIALAVVVLARHTHAVRWFVARLVFCYACGLLFFVGWPVAGPCLVYPASINATFSGLNTRAIMQSSLEEFSAIRSGGQPVTGFAYFVALPSLHVAMAVLLQLTLQQRSRIGGWVVAPINILIIASTVVLGYHYLADVPAGALLACAAIWLVRQRAANRLPASG
jgi:membrane-associated phospholipid phosphatase